MSWPFFFSRISASRSRAWPCASSPARSPPQLSSALWWSLGGSVFAYITWRFALRLRVRKALRTVSLTAGELRRRQQDGEKIVVIDGRSPLAVREKPEMVPGAVRAGLDEVGGLATTLSRDQPIVTYCV